MCLLNAKNLFLLVFIFEGLLCITDKNSKMSKKTIQEKPLKKQKALRDPFNLPIKSSAKSSAKKQSEVVINLLGIVHSSGKFGAVLEVEGKVETVFLNDDFYGFKVLMIKPDSVELIRGRIKKRLFIE